MILIFVFFIRISGADFSVFFTGPTNPPGTQSFPTLAQIWQKSAKKIYNTCSEVNCSSASGTNIAVFSGWSADKTLPSSLWGADAYVGVPMTSPYDQGRYRQPTFTEIYNALSPIHQLSYKSASFVNPTTPPGVQSHPTLAQIWQMQTHKVYNTCTGSVVGEPTKADKNTCLPSSIVTFGSWTGDIIQNWGSDAYIISAMYGANNELAYKNPSLSEIYDIVDTDAPIGGSVTYTDGYQNTGIVIVGVNRGTDALSGMSTNSAVDYLLSVASATLSAGTCGAFGGYADAGVTEAYNATSYNYTGVSGNCYKFRYMARDVAGNTTTTDGTAITKIDTTAPTGGNFTLTPSTTYTNSTSVTLNITCPTDSWTTVQFAYGNTASPTNWATCTASQAHTLTAGDGVKTVSVRFRDGGSNTTADVTKTITLDTTAPTSTTVSINAGATYTNNAATTLTLSATDATSGMSQMQFSCNNSTWSTLQAYATSASFNITTGAGCATGDGTKTVYAKFTDNAGNISTAVNDTIVYDTTVPTGNITFPVASTSYTSATWGAIAGTASDGTSGINYTEMLVCNSAGQYWNGSSWVAGCSWGTGIHKTGASWSDATIASANLTVGYTYSLYTRVFDNAGNITYITNPLTFYYTVSSTDPAYTKFLLHCDNNVTDSEPTPKTVTAYGGLAFSSTSKFGGYACLFNGSTSYLNSPSSADFDLNGNYTIDFWVNFGADVPYGNTKTLIYRSNAWLYFYGGAAPTGFVFYDSANYSISNDSWSAYAPNTWYHIAIVRNGSTVTLYRNGTAVASSGSTTASATYNEPLFIGKTFTSAFYWSGYIDEFRISNVARWTSNFTPPTSAY